jgi:WD40 repeat protein
LKDIIGAATILDAASGQVLRTLPGYPGWVWGLAFGPDGTRLATINFWETGKVWDVSTGKEVVSLQGPQQTQNSFSIAFSPDGTLLATGTDMAVILWDARSGLPLLSIPGLAGPVFSVAFSPAERGKYLAATTWDGTVRIYVVRPQDLLALARSRVTRPLTTDECRKYLHVETCP